MRKQTQAFSKDVGQLAKNARALIAATAASAGEQFGEARKSLEASMESGKEIAGRVRDKAVEGARLAAAAVRKHPYKDIGIALGVGAIIGFLVARRSSADPVQLQ